MRKIILFSAIILAVLISGCAGKSSTDMRGSEEIACGGWAGRCPNGYFCTDVPEDIVDGTGVCKRIDMKKAEKCFRNKNVELYCSTEHDCSRQRELLGVLFQHITVKYDNNLTNCSKAGLMTYDPDITKCDYYSDVELLHWAVPGRARYPEPTFRGTRTIEQVLIMAGCKPVAIENS